jgi:DNA modification methylase
MPTKKRAASAVPSAARLPWPAAAVEIWPLERILPYTNNARTHSAADIDLIARSMGEFGVTMPALVDEQGVLIAGHARVLAAAKAKLREFPVVIARDWSEAQKNAYRIADNQLAARAGWNFDTLSAELAALQLGEFDLGLIGFEPIDLAKLLGPATGLTDPDEVPAVPDAPRTKPGDIWSLGRHRVGCGDSTDAGFVTAVLAGAKPPLMVTDPPYGVDYDPGWRAKAGRRGSRALGKVLNDDRADWREAWALFPGDIAYVWHGGLHAGEVAASLTATGFGLRAQIIWGKQQLVLGRGDYHWQHEPCWYAVREGARSAWASDRKQTTLWDIPNNSAVGGAGEESWGHGTQKPVECMRRPLVNSSRPGDAVYDPFLGSGTSVIAAEITGRTCFGLELSPAYVDTIVLRWQAFTGRPAIHAESGQTFDDITPTDAHPEETDHE